MKVIVCIDDKKGMMFNNRRQSQDSAVRKDILETVENKKIWMNAYSAKQFQLENENLSIIVDEDFMVKAGSDYCFVENISLKPYIKKMEEIIIYHWNRQYPADFYFDIDVAESNWEVISQKELVGTSHENIRKEIYIQKK